MQEKTISGTIERVTFHNEENGYCVLRVRANGATKALTVVGNCAAPNAGEDIAARGEWIEDDQYGTQFKADEISTSEPGNLAGIERYLGSGLIDGIGTEKEALKYLEKNYPDIEGLPIIDIETPSKKSFLNEIINRVSIDSLKFVSEYTNSLKLMSLVR